MKKGRAVPFYSLTLILFGIMALSMAELWRHEPAALFWMTGAYFGYEISVHLLLVTAAGLGLLRYWRHQSSDDGNGDRAAIPALTVVIAAHNERDCIFDTLASVFAQKGVELQVIVASDGSTDGMNALLVERYGLRLDGDATGNPAGQRWSSSETEPRLSLLALPKVGKGGALNAGLAETQTEVVATLDADTRLAPGALAALASAFRAPETVSAGGFIYVRNAAAGRWLVRYQYWEYLKNFIWRIGLAHMGVCLQVSGAFGAFRARVLREMGGFDERSMVEDYEIIYRLHERYRLVGRSYSVEVVPAAVAYTDSPDTVSSFVHQRTRWFAGFLQTLWDYRRLVGDRRMGAVGMFMLPIKCVDAILPLWGSFSLAILLGATIYGRGGWREASFGLFAFKCGLELTLGAVMCRWHRRLTGGEKRGGLPGWRLAACIATEGLIFNWFRQIAVLNAYRWFVRRTRRWHQPRWGALKAGPEGVPSP
jgi:cellulose synthase/poly-beta-1,6-N-acetylglucosamine synthase-like glycosyltransferase